MAQFSYQDYQNQQSNTPVQGQGVSYFALKNDGDEAVVRFAYSSPEQFDLMSVHVMNIDGRMRRVNCLRTPHEPLAKCPLCAAQEKVYQKFYVKLLEYVKDENGNVVAMPRIWERPASFAKTLNGYFNEYGDVSECIFKVKRYGAKGSTDTKYEVMFANPAIYKSEIYLKDFSAFETYSLTKYVVLDKTAEELIALKANGGVTPQTSAAPVNTATYPNTTYQQVPSYQPRPVTSQVPYATPVQSVAETQMVPPTQATPNQAYSEAQFPPNQQVMQQVSQTAPYRTPTAMQQPEQPNANPTMDRPRRYQY